MQTIPVPSLHSGTHSSTFRAARFSPTDPNCLFTVVNCVPRGKGARRKAFVCKWVLLPDSTKWALEPFKTSKIGEHNVTCFDVSDSGKLLAYASSDYVVGILDSHSLAQLHHIPRSHEFPITALRFNPTSTLLVSGSSDNSARVIVIPAKFGTRSYVRWWWIVAIALLVALVATLLQMGQGILPLVS